MANGSSMEPQPWWSKLIDKHGVSTLFAVGMFLVFTGYIPSPLLTAAKEVSQNKDAISETARAIEKHAEDQKKAFDQLLRINLAECVNQANLTKDESAAEICISSLEETGVQQRRLIKKSFKKNLPK